MCACVCVRVCVVCELLCGVVWFVSVCGVVCDCVLLLLISESACVFACE